MKFKGKRLFLVSLLCISTLVEAKGYPDHWWKVVDQKEAKWWEVLPQKAQPGEVVLSKRNELGLLSNFAATPFVLDGKRYASLEGFWQMMLYPESSNDQRINKKVQWKYTREQVAHMVAFEAKKAGDLAYNNMKILGINYVTYQGKKIIYKTSEKGDHYKLILRATLAKLEQNPKVQAVLMQTKGLRLVPDHVQPLDAPPSWKYHKIYMEIRDKDLLKQTL